VISFSSFYGGDDATLTTVIASVV